MGKMPIGQAIRQASGEKPSPAGNLYTSLSLASTRLLSDEYGISTRDVEIEALKQEIVPERYERNLGTVGLSGQLALLRSKAGVAGLGGLGGMVAELLARMGVGSLVLIDGDRFADSNLNRQLLSCEDNLGKPKAAEAAKRIARVNSSVELSVWPIRAGVNQFVNCFNGLQVAVDCLDNIPSRFHLEQACQKLRIPLVHGAIAGYLGQVAVIWPGEPLFKSIYGTGGERKGGKEGVTGIETKLGNPAATPAMLASWQAGEVVKVLLNRPEVLKGELLYLDMLAGEIQKVRFF